MAPVYWAFVFALFLLLHSRLRLLKSLLASTSNFYTSNCFKYGPNKHILSYLEPTCFAYPAKLHSTSAAYKRSHIAAALPFPDPETPHPAEQHDFHSKPPLRSPSPVGFPLPSSPSVWCPFTIATHIFVFYQL